MAAAGVHCILELYGCPAGLLDDAAFVVECLRRAAARARVTLLAEVSHRFQPQGVTALGLLAESHIAIHTWPEHGYAAADLFTCGRGAAAAAACRYLASAFQARRHRLRRLARGADAGIAGAPPRKRRPIRALIKQR